MTMNPYSVALTIIADALLSCREDLAIFESKADRIIAQPLLRGVF